MKFMTVFLIGTAFLMLGLTGCVSSSAGSRTAPTQQMMLFKGVDSRQCGERVMTPANLRKEVQSLQEAGYQVLAAQCASDGMMRPAVCGAPTGDLWLVAVAGESISKAESLGYQAVAPSDDFPVLGCR